MGIATIVTMLANIYWYYKHLKSRSHLILVTTHEIGFYYYSHSEKEVEAQRGLNILLNIIVTGRDRAKSLCTAHILNHRALENLTK